MVQKQNRSNEKMNYLTRFPPYRKYNIQINIENNTSILNRGTLGDNSY